MRLSTGLARKKPDISGSPVACLILLCLLCFQTASYGAERAVLKVFLNEEDRGEYFGIVTGENRVLFSSSDIVAMGFRTLPEAAETGEDGYIYLDSLSAGIKVALDTKASVLSITADPGLLRKNTLDLSRRPENKFYHADKGSAFLNYALTYTAGDDMDFESMSVPLEFAVARSGYTGISTFSYIKNETDNRFVRLLTSIIRDEPSRMRRFVIGDFHAFSGNLGSGATLGGLSLSRNFSTAPFFIRYPGMDFSGVLTTASDVEIYANDMLLQRTHLPAGEFEFMDLPNVRGAGEVGIVIRDAFGRQESIAMPYYVSTMLLKPGLHDYSYNIGFRREEFGYESFRYNSPSLLGFHRFGFSRVFTGGFRAEADKDVINAGPSATFLLGKIGELDTSLAFSHAHGRTGVGFFTNYMYAGRQFNWRIFLKGYSRDYTNLVLPLSGTKPRLEGSASLGFRQRSLGSVSLSYSMLDLYRGTDIKRASLFYTRRLMKNVTLNLAASTAEAEEHTYEIFAGLIFILGRETSASLDYTVQEDYSRASATIQQNPPLGTGFGYRVSADRTEDDRDGGYGTTETGGNGYVEYRSPYGIYSAEYRKAWDENSYTVGASGSVAFINRSLYLSRPITDGFALVKVDDLEDVRVKFNNQDAGVTNKHGEVLIPGLISYYPNSISFYDTDCPVNYLISETEKLVSVPFRGGGVVLFDLRRIQAFTGRFSVVEKGEKTTAEYWGLELRTDLRTVQAVVGKRGEFYLENIPAGSYPARLFENGRECIFTVTIPASNETMVDMGEVVCEMD